jgi:uncharacterized protein (TIGR00375 family)
MQIVSDLHIHSRFAMACSQAITIPGIEQTACQKGINLIGTGDVTHPKWLEEIKENLEPAESGLFKMKGTSTGVRFMLTGEISTVFDENGSSKRIHNCYFMPSFEAVDSLNEVLAKKNDLSSDGRAQVSMTAAEFVETALSASKDAFVFPAHVWTPFFGALGSNTGFDSLKEAYKDQEKHIYALETGLSSDPAMNWRLSGLDKYALLSNSDMHSLPKIGREMNVFEIDEGKLSYSSITQAIKEKDTRRFKQTVEFFPEEGKYHFDGHRQCMVSVDPVKYKITNCPVCGKKLVIGVMHRINALADRPDGFVPKRAVPYVKAVPLREIIAYVLKKQPTSIKVSQLYDSMLGKMGTEFDIMLNVPSEKIAEGFGADIATAISNVRSGKIKVEPGYAGEFGRLDLLGREKKDSATEWKQKLLFQ